MGSNSIKLSAGFCALLAMMLLLLPLQWILAAVFAALFHESCHYLAIRLLSGRGTVVRLYSYGAKMPLPEMSRGRELLCALAGPLGGLCLLLLARWMPRLALCAGMQSVYNLLPIYPLDGGRALQSGLALILPPPAAGAVCRVAEIICKGAIAALALYGCFCLHLGVMPLLLAAVLLMRAK